VGAPGSGKSTFSKNLAKNDPNIVRVCPDDNRRFLGAGSHDQSVSGPAFKLAKFQVKKALDSGKNAILDATNMYRKARGAFIKIARERGAKVMAKVFECDRLTLLARNAKRGAEGGRNVPSEVIDNMLSRYERPEIPEFDEVDFISKLS